MAQALQRELYAVQKREAESAALSSERDMLQSRVRRLEEAEEVLQSELVTAQSDLATMTSQANTHRMATERVSHSTGTLPFLVYHTMSHCVYTVLNFVLNFVLSCVIAIVLTCSGPVGATEREGGTREREGETHRE